MEPSRSQPRHHAHQLHLFVDSSINPALYAGVERALKSSFPLKRIKITTVPYSTYHHCWDDRRKQLDCDRLLDQLAKWKAQDEYGLLLTPRDAAPVSRNFVFGAGKRKMGAFVATYRLGNDPNFVVKECVHEIGHVFGLGHCVLPCVMTFSNCVAAAHQKKTTLCEACRRKVYASSLRSHPRPTS
ncbi:Archaemetzincin [Balamuthia mandrillaris]